jgi:hypothetical protein
MDSIRSDQVRAKRPRESAMGTVGLVWKRVNPEDQIPSGTR